MLVAATRLDLDVRTTTTTAMISNGMPIGQWLKRLFNDEFNDRKRRLLSSILLAAIRLPVNQRQTLQDQRFPDDHPSQANRIA
ncbi:MAG: hypothetical protein ABIT64_02170 [Lysobacteraceae bacterium]